MKPTTRLLRKLLSRVVEINDNTDNQVTLKVSKADNEPVYDLCVYIGGFQPEKAPIWINCVTFITVDNLKKSLKEIEKYDTF